MVPVGRMVIAAGEALAIGRALLGAAAADLSVPVRDDALNRTLTLVRRVARVPDDVRVLRDDLVTAGIVSPVDLQPFTDMHLTIRDLRSLVPYGGPELWASTAENVAEQIMGCLGQLPSRARIRRVGATDASVFLIVEPGDHCRVRMCVKRATGSDLRMRDAVHVINVARFRRPPSAAELMRVNRRLLGFDVELHPPELVWTDKLLSPGATSLVRRFDPQPGSTTPPCD